MPKISYNLVAIIIVVSALGLAITSLWGDAPIVDEIPHTGAGYSYITKGDHRLNPEHPPLAKDIAGIALKIYGAKDQAAFDSKAWNEDINGQWEFGRKLIFNSGNDPVTLAHFSKSSQLIFFILTAVIIFTWSKKLYGRRAALLALFLFSFSPTVMAHSRFVTTDMPALFGILIGTYFYLNYLEKPTRKHLWVAGLIFGVAQLTKYSVFLLVPFFLGLAVIYAFLKFPQTRIRSIFTYLFATVMIIAIGYIFVVWPVYYFHTWHYPVERQKSDTIYLLGSYGNRTIPDITIWMADKPVIRALAEYATGLLMVTQRSIGGNTTYFMGEIRNWAWPQYFPIVYFIKEPLPFWGLVVVVLLFLAAKFRPANIKYLIKRTVHWGRNHFTELTMLLWMTAYWITSIRSNLNIGVRHLMPVYGFTFILVAGQLVKIGREINYKKLAVAYWSFVVALCGWYLYENLKVYPYYLTYFNQVAGGPEGGHLYVVDSNLDWGQDLRRFADWVNRKQINKISFDYFGWSDQTYFLKDKLVWIWAGKYKSAREFLVDNPDGGYIAVSASFFMGSRGNPETSYAWLDNYKPVTVIGNSIFVWYIPPIR